MRANDATESHADDANWRTFMVFFGKNDPKSGLNFFVVRMPTGRVRWTKGVVPAIDKIVRGLYTSDELTADAERARTGRERKVYWHADGDAGNDLWHLKKVRPTRYLWDGVTLGEVPRETSPAD